MKKLAIVTSHPVQYNAPWFKLLNQSAEIYVKVFYTWGQSAEGTKYDPGFGKKIEWDIPLLDGYEYVFVNNTSHDPGTHHFRGIINPTLNKEIENWNPDAVLVFGWSFHSHLRCMRHFHKKIPVLFRGDSTLIDEQPGIRKWVRRFFLKWVYRHIDYALYVGKENKKYFLVHGIKEKKMFFAPHAIDNSRFADNLNIYFDKASLWRKEIGIEEDDFVVLFAGKFEDKKNPFFLVDIGNKMQNPKIKFLFVGNGKLENELKRKTAGDKKFIFLDFQNQQNMPVIYRMAEIFILPSKGPGETWGLAVNEAMSCSRPIAVSDKAGCASDLIEEHINGIIFNATNTAPCIALINKLYSNKSMAIDMGMASKKIISNYSFQAITDSVLRILSIRNLNDL